MSAVDLSIVIPAYNEEDNVDACYERLARCSSARPRLGADLQRRPVAPTAPRSGSSRCASATRA